MKLQIYALGCQSGHFLLCPLQVLMLLLSVGAVLSFPFPEVGHPSSPRNDAEELLDDELRSQPLLHTIPFSSFGEGESRPLRKDVDARSNTREEIEDLVPVSITSPTTFNAGSSKGHWDSPKPQTREGRKLALIGGDVPPNYHVTSEVRTVAFQIAKKSHPPLVFSKNAPEVDLEPTEIDVPGTTPTIHSMVTENGSDPTTNGPSRPSPLQREPKILAVIADGKSSKIDEIDEPSVFKSNSSKDFSSALMSKEKETGNPHDYANTLSHIRKLPGMDDQLPADDKGKDSHSTVAHIMSTNGTIMIQSRIGLPSVDFKNFSRSSEDHKVNNGGANNDDSVTPDGTASSGEEKMMNDETDGPNNEMESENFVPDASVFNKSDDIVERGEKLVTDSHAVLEADDDASSFGNGSSKIETREADQESFFSSLESTDQRRSRIYIEPGGDDVTPSPPTAGSQDQARGSRDQTGGLEVHTAISEVNYRNFNPENISATFEATPFDKGNRNLVEPLTSQFETTNATSQDSLSGRMIITPRASGTSQVPSFPPSVRHDSVSVIDGSMAPGCVAAIVMGVLLCLIISAGGVIFYLHRRHMGIRPKVLSNSDRSCSNSDSGGNLDDQSRVAYVNSQMDLSKSTQQEDLVSLDNDSFLNSLESMTIQNLWTDTIRHTKL